MNPFGSTNYGAIQYGGVTTTPGLLASGGVVGLTLATGGGAYNPTWTYGGCGSTGTFTPSFSGAGWSYLTQYGSYCRTVSNLNTTLGSYVNTTTVNIHLSISGYPTINTQYLTLPVSNSLSNAIYCTCVLVANTTPYAGSTASCALSLNSGGNQLSFYGLPSGFNLSGWFDVFINFTYQSA